MIDNVNSLVGFLPVSFNQEPLEGEKGVRNKGMSVYEFSSLITVLLKSGV